MKTVVAILSISLLFPATIMAQIQWQTTHNGTDQGECQLASNAIRMTVYPFHVDVEEEAIITAIGDVWWGDPSTLELFGEFSLTKGSALRSMLLWSGGKILKAKLKDRAAADSAYEAIVDRSKPQVFARDPAEITFLGNNRYRFRIYPVAINNSRKVRILYSVPFQMFLNGPQFQITTAFTTGAQQTPTQIPIEIRKATPAAGTYIITYGYTKKTVQFGATYQIPITAFWADTYDEWGYYIGTSAKPIIIAPDTNFSTTAYTATLSSGKTAGNYTAVFATPPDTVLAALNELSPDESSSIEAKVVAGDKAYITDFTQMGYLGVYMKSTAAWDSSVYWTVYNSQGKTVLQCRKSYKPHSDSLIKTMLPFVWAAKYSLVEGNDYLGALFGFIDRRMSLLAQESDTLSTSEAAKWAEAGVPQLQPEEIVLFGSQSPIPPSDNVIFEFGTKVRTVLKNSITALIIIVKANRMINFSIRNFKSGVVKAALFDMGGRLLETWNTIQVSGGTAELKLPQQVKGCLILRVYAGDKIIQKRFTVVR